MPLAFVSYIKIFRVMSRWYFGMSRDNDTYAKIILNKYPVLNSHFLIANESFTNHDHLNIDHFNLIQDIDIHDKVLMF